MDPLSIAASAAGAAHVVFTILKKLAKVADADDSVQEFHSSIQTLSVVLDNVEKTFKKGKKQQTFEKRHWESINNIIQSLNSCLYALNDAIPERKGGAGNAINIFMLEWKSDLIAVKRAHISSYTQFLQVSMTAILLANQQHAQISQEVSQLKIQNLLEDIYKAKTSYHKRKYCGMDITSASGTCDSDEMIMENQIALRNVEEWVTSAEGVAKSLIASRAGESIPTKDSDNSCEAWRKLHAWRTGVAHSVASEYDGEGVADSPRSPRMSHVSSSFSDNGDVESDIGLEEPRLSDEDLDALIDAHRGVVQNEIDARLYQHAEINLKKLISLLKQRYGENSEEVADSEQKLARVLYEQRTRDGLIEGESILKTILTREGTTDDDESTDEARERVLREFSIKHTLALINLELGRCRHALKYAMSSLVKRKANHAGAALVDESCLLLASIHVRMGDPVSAAVWRKSVQRQSMSSEAGPDVFDWLRTNGFLPDTRHDSFNDQSRFNAQTDYLNARHPLHQQTPLQFAITRERNPEIVRALLVQGAAKEVADSNGATPLLLAANTRHKRLVAAILDNNVNTIAVDNDGNTALHRVQKPHGGLEAANLLLETCPEQIIDAQDRRGRTALHYAAEFGNLQMVQRLLDHTTSANVNARDFGHDTPLHLAICERQEEALIKLLIARGADINIRNVNGKDALQAAKDVKPPMQPVVGFLKEQRRLRRRCSGTSQGTMATRKSTAESLSSSSSRRESYGLSQVRLNFSTISLPFSSAKSVRSSGS